MALAMTRYVIPSRQGVTPAGTEPHPAPSAWASRARLLALALVLVASVLLPFVIWGDALERAAPLWLHSSTGASWLALVGIALLIADVVLPIPSSVVAVGLCWTLGPIAGGAVVALGSFLSFVAGYGIGRIVPEWRLRRWIGPLLWDRMRERARDADAWWIALSRPLPVLAELSAVLAGVWRLSPWRTFAQAAAASIVLGALYGGSAWLGAKAPGAIATFAVLLLPATFWVAHRYWYRRITTPQLSFPGTPRSPPRKPNLRS
jgi:uncharacterized membrane protein YdjX (TVP38/TMEM64 family)